MDNVLEMKWNDYCQKYETDAMYFHDEEKGKLIMIAEGTGDNLIQEDLDDGFVDYWYAEVYTKALGNCGGGMLTLKSFIKEDNKTIGEIIDFLQENADAFDGVADTSLKNTLIDAERGEELQEELEEGNGAALDVANFERLKKYVGVLADPSDEKTTKGLLAGIYSLFQDYNISQNQEEELYAIADPADKYNTPAEYYLEDGGLKYEDECDRMLAFLEKRAVLITNIDWQWNREDIHNLICGEYEGDEPGLSEEDFYKLMDKMGRTYESELLKSEMEDELEDALHHNALTPEDVFGLPSTLVIEAEDPATWADEDITNYLYNEYGFHIGAEGWKRDTNPVISEDDIEL